MANHEMMDYGFVEATAFDGAMPKAAAKIGTIGSGATVEFLGTEVKGMDALEVVDIEKVYE